MLINMKRDDVPSVEYKLIRFSCNTHNSFKFVHMEMYNIICFFFFLEKVRGNR